MNLKFDFERRVSWVTRFTDFMGSSLWNCLSFWLFCKLSKMVSVTFQIEKIYMKILSGRQCFLPDFYWSKVPRDNSCRRVPGLSQRRTYIQIKLADAWTVNQRNSCEGSFVVIYFYLMLIPHLNWAQKCNICHLWRRQQALLVLE